MKIIKIRTVDTNNLGTLSFFEGTRDIPFEIKRIYYTYNVPKGAKRGGHAHRSLFQFLFCPYGRIRLILDDGKEKEEVLLDEPSKGLILFNGIWRDIIWEKDNSVLCVAASDYYDENDYIRDYNEFIKLVKEGYWNE
jgi:dTDP-4-dehydrorhamnose 3,5-epimerase-like enzyme